MGLILNYLTGAPYLLMAVASVIVLMASMWVLPFKWIERIYGLLGLLMIVFAVALVAIHPPWDKLAGGFVPQVPPGCRTKELLHLRLFRGRDPVSAVMFPYEAYFYSSGGIEEEWGPKDLMTNQVTTTVGFGLGSLLAIAILASSAQLFGPANVGPEIPGTVGARGGDPVRPHRPAARAARHVVRGRRRGGRDVHGQCLCDRAILRLGMGPPQEAVGGAALHPRLDRPVPARAC